MFENTTNRSLVEQIRACKRYRTSFSKDKIAPGSDILIAGNSIDIADGAAHLTKRGYRVVGAIYDEGGGRPSLDIPVYDFIPEDLRGHTPVVFVGMPKKFHFASNRLLGKRVFWLNPEKIQKKKSRLADPNILRKIDNIGFVNDNLADSESKRILHAVIASRLHNDNGYVRVSPYLEYRNPTVHVSPGDVAVDAGAHVGKVSRFFAKACGPTGAVYSFEPDPANFMRLTDKNSDIEWARPVKAGVWSENTTLSFDTDIVSNAGHALSTTGSLKVSVVSLDKFFSAENRPVPTVLKFDIEGAEEAALIGCENLIREHKPKLMISAYHKPDDLWVLMSLVRNYRSDYKFFLGHHNYYHTETDIYAI